MPKEKDREERRRFEEKERKAWSEDDRKKFLKIADGLTPFVKHLTTPARTEKPKDDFVSFLDGLFK